MLQYLKPSHEKQGQYLVQISKEKMNTSHPDAIKSEALFVNAEGMAYLRQIEPESKKVIWETKITNGLNGQPLQFSLMNLPDHLLDLNIINLDHKIHVTPRLRAAASGNQMRHNRTAEYAMVQQIQAELGVIHNMPPSAERSERARALHASCKALQNTQSWTNDSKGKLGEARTALTMIRAGYQELPAKIGSNNGFDGVWVKTDDDGSKHYIITESKYSNTGKLKFGEGRIIDDKGNKAKQGTPDWIENIIDAMIKSKDPAIKALGEELYDNRKKLQFSTGVTSPNGIQSFNKMDPNLKQPFANAENKSIRDIAAASRDPQFKQLVQQNPIPKHGALNSGIGGVGLSAGVITDMLNDPALQATGDHHFCFAEKPVFTAAEFQQIVRELAIGVYLHDEKPMFSLHFNESGCLYPVLSPVYENTLTGKVMGMLDYMMKGFLNGGGFDEAFIDQWSTRSIKDTSGDRDQLINFQKYIHKELGPDNQYRPFRYLMAVNGIAPSEKDYAKHTSSFRIIADSAIKRHKNLFEIGQAFHVEYTIENSPGFDQFLKEFNQVQGKMPAEYQNLTDVHKNMVRQIETIMPKLPMCQKYFQLLGVIHFFSCYFTTTKAMNKAPNLEPGIGQKTSFHKILPPLPISQISVEPVPVTADQLFLQLSASTRELLNQFIVAEINTTTEDDSSEPFSIDDVSNSVQQELMTTLKTLLQKEAKFNPIIDEALYDVLEKSNAGQTAGQSYKLKLLGSMTSAVIKQARQLMNSDLRQGSKHIETLIQELIEAGESRIETNYQDAVNQSQTIYNQNLQSINNALQQAQRQAGDYGDHQVTVNYAALDEARNDARRQYNQNIQQCNNVRNQNRELLNQQVLDLTNALAEQKNKENELEEKLKNAFDHKDILENVSFTVPHVGLELKSLNANYSPEDSYRQFKIIGGCGLDFSEVKSDFLKEGQQRLTGYIQGQEPGQEKENSFSVPVVDYTTASDHEYNWLIRSLPVDTQFNEADRTTLNEYASGDYVNRVVNRQDSKDGTVRLDLQANFYTAKDRFGQTAFHYLAARGDLDLIKSVAGKFPSPCLDDQLQTPLHVAITHGQQHVVSYLLEQVSDFKDHLTKNGSSFFHLAVQHNRVAILEELIKHAGSSAELLNHRSYSDATPLQLAIHHGHDECTEILLKTNQLDVNMGDQQKQTPLHLAISMGSLDAVKLLVDYGADVNAVRRDLATPLHLAVETGDLQLCQLLVKGSQKLRVNDLLLSGATPLHLAARDGNLNVVSWLTEDMNANTKLTDNNNKDPLMIALDYHHWEVADALLPHSNLTLRDDQGQGAVELACHSGHFSFVQQCIDAGQSIDFTTRDTGFNLAHFCALHNRDDLLLYAMQKGVVKESQLTSKDAFGRTAHELALRAGHSRTFQWLHTFYPLPAKVLSQDAILFYQLGSDSLKPLQEYLQKGGRPDRIIVHPDNPKEQGSLLSFSAQKGNPLIVERLLLARASLDDSSPVELARAVASRHLEIIDILAGYSNLKHYPNHDITDERSILSQLISKGDVRMLRYMLSRGLRLQNENQNQAGLAPLERAIKGKNLDMVKLILQLTLDSRQAIDWPHMVATAAGHADIPVMDFIMSAAVKPANSESRRLKNEGLAAAVTSGRYENARYFLEQGADAEAVLHHDVLNPKQKQLSKNAPVQIHALRELLLGYLPHEVATQNRLPEAFPLVETGLGLIPKLHHELLQQGYVLKPLTLEEMLLQDTKGLTTLHLAAALGKTSILEQAKRLGVDFNQPLSRSGPSIAAIAVEAGELGILQWLVNSGQMDLHPVDQQSSLIARAISAQNESVAHWLIKQGMALDAVNEELKTPLFQAIMRGSLSLVQAILTSKNPQAHSVDLKRFCTQRSMSYIHAAALMGNMKIMQYLVAMGASLDQIDNEGKTPLHYAATQQDLGVVRYLYNLRPDQVNEKCYRGQLPLHDAIASRQDRISEFLVHGMSSDAFSQPIKPDVPHTSLLPENVNKLQPDAFHLAARIGNEELVGAMVRKGGVFTREDSAGNSVVDYALMNNQQKMADFLYASHQFSSQTQKIHHFSSAILSGSTSLVQSFMARKTDDIPYSANMMLNNKTTPLVLASSNGDSRMAALLTDRGAQVDDSDLNNTRPLLAALANDQIQTATVLIESGANINCADEKGMTPLHYAAQLGAKTLMLDLLMANARLGTTNLLAQTALDLALLQGHQEIAELLFVFGDRITIDLAKVESQTAEKMKLLQSFKSRRDPSNTRLHYVVDTYNLPILEQLLKIDPVNSTNAKGETALWLASDEDMIQRLTDAGADINHKDNNGHTILDAVLRNENKALMNALIKRGAVVSNYENKHGKNLLLDAFDRNNKAEFDRILEIPIEKVPFSRDQFKSLLASGDIHQTLLFLSKQKNVKDSMTQSGLSALIAKPEMTQVIIHWFNINSSDLDALENGLYHAAIHHKDPAIVDFVHSLKPDPFKPNHANLSALSVMLGQFYSQDVGTSNQLKETYRKILINHINENRFHMKNNELELKNHSQLYHAIVNQEYDVAQGLEKTGHSFKHQEEFSALLKLQNKTTVNMFLQNMTKAMMQSNQFKHVRQALFTAIEHQDKETVTQFMQSPAIIYASHDYTKADTLFKSILSIINNKTASQLKTLIQSGYPYRDEITKVPFDQSFIPSALHHNLFGIFAVINSGPRDPGSQKMLDQHFKDFSAQSLNVEFVNKFASILASGGISIGRRYNVNQLLKICIEDIYSKKEFLDYHEKFIGLLYFESFGDAAIKIEKGTIGQILLQNDTNEISYEKAAVSYYIQYFLNKDQNVSLSFINQSQRKWFALQATHRGLISVLQKMESENWQLLERVSYNGVDNKTLVDLGLSSKLQSVQDFFKSYISHRQTDIGRITQINQAIEKAAHLKSASKELIYNGRSDLIPHLINLYYEEKVESKKWNLSIQKAFKNEAEKKNKIMKEFQSSEIAGPYLATALSLSKFNN